MTKNLKDAFDAAKGAPGAVTKSLRDSTSAAPAKLRARAALVLILVLALFGGISAYKYMANKKEQEARETELAAGPRVRFAKVVKSPGEHRLTVIGETRPFESATIYAKVSGYLKKVVVDKGDVVNEGQVLAIIESPETDEAYLAAEADSKNKSSILARMQTLFNKQLVSQQEFDQAQADAEVANARLRSQRTLKSYETLRAPFPGTITARYADPGALVQNATSSETSALPIAMISQIRRLKIDVFVDQRDAPFIEKDAAVDITLPERPGYKLKGQVARISGELDPRTKMLLTEIDINNEDRALVAGSFVQVSILVKSPSYLQAPVEGLFLRGDKAFLTVITADNKVAYRPIEIASNDGKNLNILSGVELGEVVALNLGDSLPEGNKVRPIEEVAVKPPAAPIPATPAAAAVTAPAATTTTPTPGAAAAPAAAPAASTPVVAPAPTTPAPAVTPAPSTPAAAAPAPAAAPAAPPAAATVPPAPMATPSAVTPPPPPAGTM